MTSCSCEGVLKFVLQSVGNLVRKMSKLNGENPGVAGDFGAGSPVDMVTSIHEHITCTKEIDPFGPEDTKDGKIAYPCELDHMYASMAEARTLREENNEMIHCKELVLLHLDLIQQQSEQIVMKDKELASLRQEVETLKQRLERMDRRVNLQKHREVSEIGPLNCGSPAPGSPASPFGHNILPLSCSDGEVDEEMDVGNGTRSLTPSAVMVDAKPSINLLTNVLQFPQVTLPNNTNSNTNITPLSSMSVKRKRLENGPCAEPDSSVNNRRRRRRLASWSSDTPSSGTRRSGATQLVDGAAVADSQDSVEPISRRNRVSSAQNVQRSTKTPQNKVNQWESRSARTRSAVLVKRDAVLVTSEHYYTPVGDEDFHWCAANDELAKTQTSSVEVEVPSWRIRVCTSCYSMEGTENLGDEVFNKRHMRLEIDERRRKRWDIQRIREQRQYERLKQREGVKSTGRSHRHSRSHRSSKAGSGVAGEELDRVEDSSDIESFWPDPEDAKFLEVSDDVPVSAFGVPLVKFEPSTFSTSWGSPRCKPEAPVTNNSRRKYDGRR